jgi:hypothetical protein
VNGEHKITSGHQARTALVYLRQSALVQVREHTESTMRQYALADTAVRLGWAPRDVEVTDRDLGLSGTSAAHRQGFRELMSRVCLGEVGAVLGLEVSRLARSNADLARLAEMARLTGTLLIDGDGVTGKHQRASRAAELAVERARYEAEADTSVHLSLDHLGPGVDSLGPAVVVRESGAPHAEQTGSPGSSHTNPALTASLCV